MEISNQRKKYDSFIIWLYNQNKENLIPAEIKNHIPYSTASAWRNLEYSNYFGHEVRQMQNEALEYYELFENYKNLKRTFNMITKVWVNVSEVLMPMLHKCKEHQEMVANEVQRLFTVFPKKIVHKLTHISPSAFYTRLNRLKVKCGVSPLELCFQRHPLQLAKKEVEKIKTLFKNPDFSCWPASSIYYHALRKNELFISLSTFYKYVNLLGLKRKWRKSALKDTNPVITTKPNEFIHILPE